MEEHDRIADEGEKEADRMEERSGEVERNIEETREDWDAKTKTESAPGAMPLPSEDDEDEEDKPNEFEFEERSPETADAQGPDAAEDDDSDDSEDSDDS